MKVRVDDPEDTEPLRTGQIPRVVRVMAVWTTGRGTFTFPKKVDTCGGGVVLAADPTALTGIALSPMVPEALAAKTPQGLRGEGTSGIRPC